MVCINVYIHVYRLWRSSICLKMYISYTSPTEKLLNINTEGTKMVNPQKEVQVKLMKGLLDLIILQFISCQPMHGYQVITKIRKTFGVYFSPSTIYPLLATLEKKGYVNSQWNMKNERPRKVYKLTTEGQKILNFTENSLSLICQKLGQIAHLRSKPKRAQQRYPFQRKPAYSNTCKITHIHFFIVSLGGTASNLNFVRFAWNCKFPKRLLACF